VIDEMTQVGIIEIKDLNYDELMTEIESFLEYHAPENVDSTKELTFWYTPDQKGEGNLSIEKFFTFDFWTRKKTQYVDPLTKNVIDRIITQDRRICVINKKENDKEHTIYIVADKGSANAITAISKNLHLDVSMRRKISFDEDFIEYLNTAEFTDKNYNKIFDRDMESTSRKARKDRHRISEDYLDLSMREPAISEQFRDAAGVRIVVPVKLGKQLPTIEIIIYNNGWINFIRPKREDDEVTYYEAMLYGISRLSEGYNSFMESRK
jgi:hypothetical protein